MRKKILTIASTGGHWVQLQRMRPAWDGLDVTYVTTEEGHRQQVMLDSEIRKQNRPTYYAIIDANRWQKFRLLYQLLQISWILLRVRPNVVISTGAAPGFFAIKVGKLIGARTIWVDSIANAEELSLSGKQVNSSADLWLTQWPDLAGEGGERERDKPAYKGSVI